jgi:hypothetical protein
MKSARANVVMVAEKNWMAASKGSTGPLRGTQSSCGGQSGSGNCSTGSAPAPS